MSDKETLELELEEELLRRLLQEGLIEHVRDGDYNFTKRGEDAIRTAILEMEKECD